MADINSMAFKAHIREMRNFNNPNTEEEGRREQPKQDTEQRPVVKEESAPVQEKKQGRGRPAKERLIPRDVRFPIRFDQDTHKKISMLRIMHNIYAHDIVFAATKMFLDKYLHNGELDQEAIDYINSVLQEYEVNK